MVICQECLIGLDELMSTLSWVMSRVLDDPLISDDHQGGMCCLVSGMVRDNPLICDDRQVEVCRVVSRKLPDDPLIHDDR